jgi:hypothetical protein
MRYEINHSTFAEHARRLGLPTRHPLLDADEVTKAAELYLEGLLHMSIAPDDVALLVEVQRWPQRVQAAA